MTNLTSETNDADPTPEPVVAPPNDSIPETEVENDWENTWICTKENGDWTQHDGDRFEITPSGVALFYQKDRLTGASKDYEAIFRKDLIDVEWLYDNEVAPRPKPEPTKKALEVDIKLPDINKSSVHPTDADGFYSVTDCLPKRLAGFSGIGYTMFVTLKYVDGRTETGIFLSDKLVFQRSRFSWAPNLAFAKTLDEVVGWKYR